MALQLRHIKGYTGRLRGSLQAHPIIPCQFYYVVGSIVVAVFDDDPTRQVQLRGHDDDINAFAMSSSGRMLATGQRGSNADVVVWDTETLAERFRFQEHDLEVCQVGFSWDEKLLATVGNDRERRLFVLDTSTGKIVTNTTLPEPKRTTALAWSPVSDHLCYSFATAMDWDVIIWTVDPWKGWVNGDRVTPGSARRSITTLTFSADGAWLFAGTVAGDIITINVHRRAVQLMHPVCEGGVGATVAAAGLTPLAAAAPAPPVRNTVSPHPAAAALGGAAGTRMLVGAGDGTLCLFDFAQPVPCGLVIAAVPGMISSVSPVAAGPPPSAGGSGRPASSSSCGGTGVLQRLLVGTQEGGIFLVDVASGHAVGVHHLMHSQQGPIKWLSFAADDPSSVATASLDGTVCVWSTQDFTVQTRALEQKAGGALSVTLGADQAISGWADGFIRCHARGCSSSNGAGGATTNSAATATLGRHTTAEHAAGAAQQLWCIPHAHALAHSCGTTAIKLSNRGQFVASGGAGGEIRLWDVASREMVAHMKHHKAPITDLQVLIDDSHLLAASEDRSWSIWDCTAEKARAIYQAEMGAVRGIAMAPDQVSVVSVGLDRAVHVWDIRQAAPVRTIKEAHKGEVSSVAVSRRGHLIATGGADAHVRLWDFASGGSRGGFLAHTRTVNKLGFTPDDNQVASVGDDAALVVWRL